MVAYEKIVIFKRCGVYCTTLKQNYEASVMDKNQITSWENFNSPEEIIDYCVQYCGRKKEDFVIEESTEMRNKLISSLKEMSCVYNSCEQECVGCGNLEMYDSDIKSIADHLVRDGWIKPPCKKWDEIYFIYRRPENEGGDKIVKGKVVAVKCYNITINPVFWLDISYKDDDNLCESVTESPYGELAFLSYKDAEIKLKGGIQSE